MKIITGKIRMNYTNIFTKKSIEGEEPRYSLSILIPKSDTKTISNINEAIFKSKEKGINIWKSIVDNIKSPLRDGDIEKIDNEAYKNHYFLNATSKYKPGIVNKNLEEITDSSEIYLGCYGKVSLNFYPYNKDDTYGVGCCINNVQKISDGERISISSAKDDFTIIEDEDILS